MESSVTDWYPNDGTLGLLELPLPADRPETQTGAFDG